ncbi:alpha/beta fold hydrolase [Piscinibacter sakaiensis]|uniref:alpha/beta hydrolase family protein n=1 Tax=Piscinibacter sakaiensis TaxID=1547922 RepID=UPI0006B4C2B0|nr:alpha/beta fold hydrolase [Piscinibacter sakaiensis]
MPSHDEPVEIAVDDASISGTFVVPGTRVPGVLFVHGWGGTQQQYLTRAREIAALGCICLTFDLRGHASTLAQSETVTRENNLRDVLAAYDRLAARRHVDPERIALVGSSYGGYLGAIASTLRPVRWLALRAPALYQDSGWEIPKRQLHRDQDLPTYRRQLVRAADNRALAACEAFRGDVLLVESEHDAIVPAMVLASYREACTHARSVTYRCLEGADHGLSSDESQAGYLRLLRQWLAEMVETDRQRSDERAARPAAEASPTRPSVAPETPPKAIAPEALPSP